MSSRPERPVFGFGFDIQVLSARVAQKNSGSGLFHSHPEYYVVLDVDGRHETTSQMGEKELKWDQKFSLQGTNLSKIRISMFQNDKKRDKMLGDICLGMDALAEFDDGGMMELELTRSSKSKSKTKYYVSVTISVVKEASLAAVIHHPVVRAEEQARAINRLELPEVSFPLLNDGDSIGQDAWPLLMDRLAAFVTLVDKVSEIHPYAKLAWDVTSAAYKLVRGQINRDLRISQLVVTIWEAYEIVEAAEPLNQVLVCRSQIQALALNTVECAYFVRGYAKFSSFGTRILVNIASDVDGQIQQFEETFKKIQLALQQRINLDVALTVTRISAKVEQIADDVAFLVLNNMCFHRRARYDPDLASPLKLPDKTIDLLSEWINSPEDGNPRRLWLLTGDDRSEISAIASTICSIFGNQKRLASSFFCRRTGDEPMQPKHVLATIGRQLADYDDGIKSKLYHSLRKDIALAGTEFPEVQFSEFLARPLKPSEAEWEIQLGPSVVVIDSLDLCGDGPSRERLLRVLFDRIHELPSNFRFIITSLRDTDIVKEFKARSANDSAPTFIKPLIGTMMVDNRCFRLQAGEFFRASMTSMRKLSERTCTETWSGIQLYVETALRWIADLAVNLPEYTTRDSTSRLILPMEKIHRLIEAISVCMNDDKSASHPGHLISALQHVSAMLYLVDAIVRNSLVEKEAKILQRIGDLFAKGHSFLTSEPLNPPNFHPIHTVRLLADPRIRSCHPMFLEELTCQSSTRNGVIQLILEWATNTADRSLPSTFLLSGNPGSGKTTIAHSVTRHLLNKNLLAWAFFNELCGKAGCKEYLFSAASEAFVEITAFRLGQGPGDQLAQFFHAALQYEKLGIAGPVVFVFDGLDQSFPTPVVEELGRFLENEARSFSNIRFFITCASSNEGLVSMVPSAAHLHMTCNGRVETRGEVPILKEENHPEVIRIEPCGQLKWTFDYAQELFNFVQESDLGPAILPIYLSKTDPAHHPRQYGDHTENIMKTLGGDYRLARVFLSLALKGELSLTEKVYVHKMSSQGRPEKFFTLYGMELAHALPLDSSRRDRLLFDFRLVMGMCKLASHKSLLGLDFFDETPDEKCVTVDRKVFTWLEQLSSVCLAQVGSQKIVLVNKTFEDFLFDPNHPHYYSVTLGHCQLYMPQMCLWVMRRQLGNAYFSNIDSMLSLKYACREWTRHLRSVPLHQLPDFFWSTLQSFIKSQIPDWIELLARFGSATDSVGYIQELVEWLLTSRDGNKNVVLIWYCLVRKDGLNHVRRTTQDVNPSFEQTMEKAESFFNPILIGWSAENSHQ